MNLPVKSGDKSPHSIKVGGGGGGDASATTAAAAAAADAADAGGIAAWLDVWRRRREPSCPFDGHFFAFEPAVIRVDSMAARRIEAAVKDPAGLWFGEVLQAERVAWEPFTRKPRIALGSLTHRVIAAALRGEGAPDGFARRPDEHGARRRAREMLAELRALWPANDYWDSFHAELARNCDSLLGKVSRLDAGPFVATEARVPEGTRIALDADGFSLAVRGRMDLVLLDRPEWRGARVDIVDFKTGGDERLAAAKMAAAGASLQLGVYLAAARALGAADGRVWMLKPGVDEPAAVAMDELPEALSALARLARHLRTGVVGALTPDRNEYSDGGYIWPAACAPVPFATLKAKFAATFGGGGEDGAGDGAGGGAVDGGAGGGGAALESEAGDG
ncbi:MAG: PD-(D/E)XK nuclease family protein [Opitutaceae bacterium]|jgi:hypothetical protein|nr:PD-(D/E)XK nuclease family protein [Opitutaceae bacterium]